jgi:hypothetical protein
MFFDQACLNIQVLPLKLSSLRSKLIQRLDIAPAVLLPQVEQRRLISLVPLHSLEGVARQREMIPLQEPLLSMHLPAG